MIDKIFRSEQQSLERERLLREKLGWNQNLEVIITSNELRGRTDHESQALRMN